MTEPNTPTTAEFIDRILASKETAQSISDDIKEIYAEAKEVDYDKTALDLAVAYIVKKKRGKPVDETDDLVQRYLTEYEGVPHTHTRARVANVVPITADKPKAPFKPWLKNG